MPMESSITNDHKLRNREHARHYMGASVHEVDEMLASLGLHELSDLYAHISKDLKFDRLSLPDELSYDGVKARLSALSQKNNIRTSFLGDALPVYKTHEIVDYVSSLRALSTSYTPYQAERSQGTLISLWIYQCALAQLTGFEAINASLYERSTATFEALCCALRIQRKKETVLVSESLFPQDLEVIQTLAHDAPFVVETYPVDKETGQICLISLKEKIEQHGSKLAAIAFPQVNQLGLLEDVDVLTNLAKEHGVLSVSVIDPMQIATGGLKPPSLFGTEGCDIFVAEAQHLAIGANFGGPGLGVFGVRLNQKTKNHIRSTPGRYVGRGKSVEGEDAFLMVLSTREQHIRKEKATSNICSNQAFLATLAGAALLGRGENGMAEACKAGFNNVRLFLDHVLQIPGLTLAFPETPFFNECLLSVPESPQKVLNAGLKSNLHIGIDVSGRLPGNASNVIKVSFSDIHSQEDIERLIEVFESVFGSKKNGKPKLPEVPAHLLRHEPARLPSFSVQELKEYYAKLAELNANLDNGPYPLGSCTMKYNPKVNDWAATRPGFTEAHPQAPVEDVQGSLELLYEIQEWFKSITGLAGLTTQPVAGAQGELVGVKLFQAYHRNKGEVRDVILIPKSAHGTNFATAVMAGFTESGIVQLNAEPDGEICFKDLDAKIKQYGNRISGIMITNPNTGGVFESRFKEIADKIHAVDGLVYMDGANMNAIAGWVDLGKMGVDAVHNNLHKTWTIPHGGGGPGDAIVAVSEKLLDFLPGCQIVKEDGLFRPVKAKQSIGSFHRHWGNFAHKVRCYTYLLRLGREGVPRMSAVAVLSARYLFKKLSEHFPTLPSAAQNVPRMHEFIVTLSDADFQKLETVGIPKAAAMPRVGKVFLDLGYHSPTVAFPEPLGLMIEPTESFSKDELDRFAEAAIGVLDLIQNSPESVVKAPIFTPVKRIDEVLANRNLIVSEKLDTLPRLPGVSIKQNALLEQSVESLVSKIKEA